MGGLCLEKRCSCSCSFESAPDKELLHLLKDQLTRCGPEQLAGRVIDCATQWSLLGASLTVGVLLGIFLSVAVGALWQPAVEGRGVLKADDGVAEEVAQHDDDKTLAEASPSRAQIQKRIRFIRG